MENFILTTLRTERYPLVFRYAVTIAIIAVALFVKMGLARELEQSPLLVFVPAIFLVALLFDSGCGYAATFLGGLAALYFFEPGFDSFAAARRLAAPLVIYAITGILVSVVTETLRNTLRGSMAVAAQNALLLQEAAHRNRNDLMIISSIIGMQARLHSDPAAKEALEAAVLRVNAVAQAQSKLDASVPGGVVEISAYLHSLCSDLGDRLRGVRPIIIAVQADRMEIPSSSASTIGLIVNELVTNSFKHAFPDDREGTVEVIFQRFRDRAVLTVRDDGVGGGLAKYDVPAPEGNSGLGTRLLRMLARQLRAELVRSDAGPGRMTSVTFSTERLVSERA